jgi:hypothetical protein
VRVLDLAQITTVVLPLAAIIRSAVTRLAGERVRKIRLIAGKQTLLICAFLYGFFHFAGDRRFGWRYTTFMTLAQVLINGASSTGR